MPRTTDASTWSIAAAAQMLQRGGVVAFPTETVYGLGADTFNSDALETVFRLKGRPDDNPLIAHVQSVAEAHRVAADWNDLAETLAEHFWPGPLTMILSRHPDVPTAATAGLDTIALRCPNHPVAQALLGEFGGPISAPSANRSGHVSPTAAAHVTADFAEHDDLLILDGGRCEIGIESTVVDLTSHPPRVLRPGFIAASTLGDLLGEVEDARSLCQSASPGTSALHYAPRTPSMLLPQARFAEHLAASGGRTAFICFDATDIPSPHLAIGMPHGAGDYARQLYDALRRADAAGVDRIIIEEPPQSNNVWMAILDRLQRATARDA